MLLQRVVNGGNAMSPREALEIVTRVGTDILGRPECECLSVVKRADITIGAPLTLKVPGVEILQHYF